MSLKRKHPFPSTSTSTKKDDEIFRSAPTVDRDSTFQGFYSPSIAPKALQNYDEFKTASHKILGYRRESNQQSLTSSKQYVTGHDDDGEKYGGSKVEKVLVAMGVTGACVVARWYGGTMLGLVRFEHMERAAREAVEAWKDSVAEEGRKKRKMEDEAKEKEKLSRVLRERDQSVGVLRTLAVEKEGMVKAKKDEEANGASREASLEAVIVDATISPRSPPGKSVLSSPAPEIDYEGMAVERLRSLEKARDASIAFLLKRIDKAEAELAELAKVFEKASEQAPEQGSEIPP